MSRRQPRSRQRRSNGASVGKQMDRKEEMQAERDKRQRHNNLHQQNQQFGHKQQFEEQKAVYLEKLMQTEMSDAGINLLDNMVDRSFILGNIDDAEYHDLKWQLHAIYLKIKGVFPPEESEVTGDVRAFVLDDPDENLKPLTGQQRIIIAEMIRGITLLASRSKDGFQQEMNVKSITVSEVMDPESDEDDSVKLGLFGGR